MVWRSKDISQRRDTVSHRHMKRCSASLITREMWVKTTVRYLFAAVRMAVIGHLLQITNAVGGYGERDRSYTDGESEQKLPLSETNTQQSKNRITI